MKHISTIITAMMAMLTCYVPAAFAQDRCEDVLINKVMDTQEYKRDNTFLLTLATQTKDYLKRSDSNKIGLGFEIEGVPIAISDDSAEQFERQIANSLNLTEFQRDSVYYLLQSGQRNIIDAWDDCMSQRGGLILTFEAQNEHRGVLHIDYIVPKDTFATWPDLTLQENVPIPAGFKINTGMDCLKLSPGKPAHIFKQGSHCDVDFELPADWAKDRAAWTTWSVVLRAKSKDKELSFSTYLAPRAKLVATQKVWPAPGQTMKMAGIYNFNQAKVVSKLDCKAADAGYVFLNKFNLHAVEWGHTGGHCQVDTAAIQPPGTEFCLSSAIGNSGESGDYYCQFEVAGTEIKFEFEPAEPNASPADFASFSVREPAPNQIQIMSQPTNK